MSYCHANLHSSICIRYVNRGERRTHDVVTATATDSKSHLVNSRNEYESRLRSKEGVQHDRQNCYLCRAKRTRLNSRIPCPYLHAQSPTANPTGIEGSRTYITPEPSPVKLVGKRTSTVAAAGSGSKGQIRGRGLRRVTGLNFEDWFTEAKGCAYIPVVVE